MISFPGPNSFFCISPWRSWLAQMEKSSPAWQTSTGFLNLHLGKLFLSRSSFYFQELNCLQQSYRGNLISNMCLIDKCGLLFRIRINFANYFHLTGLPSLREVWKGSITKFLISSLLSSEQIGPCSCLSWECSEYRAVINNKWQSLGFPRGWFPFGSTDTETQEPSITTCITLLWGHYVIVFGLGSTGRY